MSRRGKGEGSVVKWKGGLWRGRIEVGRDANGKRVRKVFYGKTKTEVTDELTRLAKSRLDGTLTIDSKVSVGDFLDEWLKIAVKTANRASTHASYEQNVRVHIKPQIGTISLSKLTSRAVQKMYAEFEKKNMSARLRQLNHAIMRRALKIARKWGLVGKNVCDDVDRPTAPKHEIKPLLVPQVNAFLQSTQSLRIHSLLVFALTTGVRQGELLSLLWEDVDLDACTVTIRRTIVELDGVITITPPKTAKAHRLITLPAVAVEALRKQKEMLTAEGLRDCPIVFPGRDGKHQSRYGRFRTEFKQALQISGIPKIRFHDLRHSSATMLLLTGTHPKVVQERLGHATIGITMDTYSHVLPTLQREAASTFDNLINKP